MTIKKLVGEAPKPAPKSAQSITIQPDPTRPLLRFREGWFFGMGFFSAAFVFSFVIVPAIACMAAVALAIMGIGLGQ